MRIKMTDQAPDTSLRQAAVVTGVSILVMAVAAVLATDVTIGSLVVPGDARATTGNIQASGMLFRSGILSWLIVLVCDVLAAWGLYIYFKPVNRSLSLLMACFRLVYAAILGTALANYVKVLLLVSGDDYQAALGIHQLQAQVMLFLDAFNVTWSIGLAVFGFHILVLGYLVVNSGYIPKFFGVLLIIAFLGYLITTANDLLIPGRENFKTIVELLFAIPMIVGEVGLGLWLLIKGGKGTKC
jgi:hypothetical protein